MRGAQALLIYEKLRIPIKLFLWSQIVSAKVHYREGNSPD